MKCGSEQKTDPLFHYSSLSPPWHFVPRLKTVPRSGRFENFRRVIRDISIFMSFLLFWGGGRGGGGEEDSKQSIFCNSKDGWK